MSPWTASMRWVHPRGSPELTNCGAADTAGPKYCSARCCPQLAEASRGTQKRQPARAARCPWSVLGRPQARPLQRRSRHAEMASQG